MKATAVIGACFGDEGKGLMVDFLSRPESLNVRFSGGAQAGHTVVAPDGWRHVFHHFGSGSRRGAATYLSADFVANPLLWQKELKKLQFNPKVFIHPDAKLTTPFDMFINQVKEAASPHGSCGIGIHETMLRCQTEFGTTARDLASPKRFGKKVADIRDNYVAWRLHALGLPPVIPSHIDLAGAVHGFGVACSYMYKHVTLAGDEIINKYQHVVFEGAQGLLLDERHGFFPHVTHGNTGLTNVSQIARRLTPNRWGIGFDVIYVTRSYMTRHGLGPFPTEDQSMLFEDATNTHNEFQGKLRFGVLDFALVGRAIRQDLEEAGNPPSGLAVTHLDQHRDEGRLDALLETAEIDLIHGCYGPTRDSVFGMPIQAKA